MQGWFVPALYFHAKTKTTNLLLEIVFSFLQGAKILWDYGHTFYGLPTDMMCMTDVHCENLYSSKQIQHLLNSTKFDLVNQQQSADANISSYKNTLCLVKSNHSVLSSDEYKHRGN